MKKIISILFIPLMSVGCATVMKHELETVQVTSTPPGAYIDPGPKGEACYTPCEMELPRKRSYEVTVSKEGYQKESFKLNGKSLDPWLWGNLVFIVGAPVAVAVDFWNGKAYDYSPKEVKLDLKPLNSPSVQ